MAHHSDEEFNRSLANMFAQKEKLGATGKFPQGKLVGHDEGEIRFAVGVKDRKVVIDFGTSVKWMGMDRNQAIELADLLIKHATTIK